MGLTHIQSLRLLTGPPAIYFAAHIRRATFFPQLCQAPLTAVTDVLWISDAIPNAADIDEENSINFWYLAFGYMDDYWRVIEDYASQTDSAWTNADQLEIYGSALGIASRSAGYAETKHRKHERNRCLS